MHAKLIAALSSIFGYWPLAGICELLVKQSLLQQDPQNAPQSGPQISHASWNPCNSKVVADPIGSKPTQTSSLSTGMRRLPLCFQFLLPAPSWHCPESLTLWVLMSALHSTSFGIISPNLFCCKASTHAIPSLKKSAQYMSSLNNVSSRTSPPPENGSQ